MTTAAEVRERLADAEANLRDAEAEFVTAEAKIRGRNASVEAHIRAQVVGQRCAAARSWSG